MAYLHNQCTETHQTGLSSELLKDIIKLQTNQNVFQAKKSLEKQINALKAEHEILAKQSTQPFKEGAEWNPNPKSSLSQRSTDFKLNPSTSSYGISLEDIDMDDGTEYKGARNDTENMKRYKDKDCGRSPFNEEILFPYKSSGNQPIQSLPSTITNDTASLLAENRTGR